MDDIHWLDPTSLSFFADLGASGRRSCCSAPRAALTRTPPLASVSRRWRTSNGCPRSRWTPRTQGGSSRERSAPVTRTGTWLRCSGIEREETRSLLKNCREWLFANRLLFIDGAVQARSSVAATKGELDGILERQGLPGTIEGVIRRRLDGLSPQDVSVLRAASVVGQSFDRDLCSAGAPTLTPVEVERSLAALTGLGVIEPSDRGPTNSCFATQSLGTWSTIRCPLPNAVKFTTPSAPGSRRIRTRKTSARCSAPFPAGAKNRQGDTLSDRGRRNRCQALRQCGSGRASHARARTG